METRSRLRIVPLNTLGNKLQAKTYTALDATYILTNLSEFIQMTAPPEPRGDYGKDYRLNSVPEHERFNPKSAERRLEAELFWKFKSGDIPFCEGVSKIVSFQAPLYWERTKKGWGSIDLLGIDNSTRCPVVIELKLAKKTIEPPLRAVVEAFAYMIALRGVWDDFAPQWQERTSQGRLPKPKKLCAVVVAPRGYWDAVCSDKHLRSALPALKTLVDGLANEGYIIRFASIVATDNSGWKVTGGAREIIIPCQQ